MDKITVVCPHCLKTNALPKKESYAKPIADIAKNHCLTLILLSLTQAILTILLPIMIFLLLLIFGHLGVDHVR